MATTRALTHAQRRIRRFEIGNDSHHNGGCGVTRARLAKQRPTQEEAVVAINETDQMPININ